MNYRPTARPNLETSPISPCVASGCCPRQLGSRGFKRGENPPVRSQGQCDRCCLRWVQDSHPRVGRDHTTIRAASRAEKQRWPSWGGEKRGEAGRRGVGRDCLPLAVFSPLARRLHSEFWSLTPTGYRKHSLRKATQSLKRQGERGSGPSGAGQGPDGEMG